jgi:hypothetical protein
MFFFRYEAPDTNGDLHHILLCSELVYCDAISPSLFSLCATTLLGQPDGLVVKSSTRSTFTLQPYQLPPTAGGRPATGSNVSRQRGERRSPAPTAGPSTGTRSKVAGHRGRHNCLKSTAHPSSVQNPRGYSRTLFGIRKMSTLEYRVGVRGRSLWKVNPFHAISYYILLSCH